VSYTERDSFQILKSNYEKILLFVLDDFHVEVSN